VRVEADGPVRIVRLRRPDQLNAVNEDLHLGLTRVFPLLSADAGARVAVITGEGRAFSAGGDFDLLDRMANDRVLRRNVIAEGRELVLNMIRCRVPVVAAVNGPAVGLGCSVVALSDVVYMAESAYLADPHVVVGLVAADGGPLTWPLHTSLLLAKEYAFTGDRIPAKRAAEIGLVNHVCADGEVLPAALKTAHRIAALPQQAVEAHQARTEPARRALRARHDRLRDVGRDGVVRDRRPAQERGTLPEALVSARSRRWPSEPDSPSTRTATPTSASS
jgi:enoyl-CoA hydratase/carnithine racemase